MSNSAFIFPGQGSQRVGMLNRLYKHYSIVNTLFTEASEILGFDLWQLCSEGPEDKLNQTAYTQPAILVASYAIWNVWLEMQGEMPSLLAGHSLGEYTALVCAEVISFSEAVKLVHQRGLLMQQAVEDGKGAMAAIIGLNEKTIKQLCEENSKSGIVSPANYNSKGQTVIAGETNTVAKVMEAAKKAGARKVVKLDVSVPSHCALMKPAAQKFNLVLNQCTFNDAKIPIINNVAAHIEINANLIKAALVEQLTQPVQWVRIIDFMANHGIDAVTECGPGKVLTGLNRRINTELTYHVINSYETLLSMLRINEERICL